MIDTVYRVKIAFLIFLALLILVCIGLLIFVQGKKSHYENGVYVNNSNFYEVKDYAKII